MDNKKLYIGLGVLAVAGIGFYLWKKKQGESSETEEKANAIGRRTLGVSRGNLGGGIVAIADPAKLCCCAGTTDSKGWCNNPSTRCCPDIAGQPAPLPTNVGFSGAIGRFGNVGLSTNVIQNTVSCAIKERDCYKAGCGQGKYCSNPKPATTTTATASGANGFNYNGTIRMVSPLNY